MAPRLGRGRALGLHPRRTAPRAARGSRHRHGLTAAEIEDLVDALSIQAEIVEPLPDADPALRDAADQPVLGTLLAALQASRADYLVTGDNDLLVLADRHPIVTRRSSGPPTAACSERGSLMDAASSAASSGCTMAP